VTRAFGWRSTSPWTNKIPNALVGVLAARAAASTLAGCGGSGQHGVPGAKSWTQYNAEFLGEQRTLMLPPGIGWPKRGPEPATYQGASNTFQDGVGRGDADAYWYCAWEERWLHDQGASGSAATHDLEEMRHLAQTTFYTHNTMAQDRHIYNDAWTRAGLGDPSLVQQDVTANCGQLLHG
jgi:hypothetical protein